MPYRQKKTPAETGVFVVAFAIASRGGAHRETSMCAAASAARSYCAFTPTCENTLTTSAVL